MAANSTRQRGSTPPGARHGAVFLRQSRAWRGKKTPAGQPSLAIDILAPARLYEGVRLFHALVEIIREGVPPRFLTLALEGYACTCRDRENGQRQTPSILLPGDLAERFGILLDFADHSVSAVTQVTLAQVNPDAIRGAASARPGSSRFYAGICS